ncbi:FAS associated factor 2 [Echinococcus multilocularis]|uniref:FAS associated factor 2 n=1 Tax=Echinococcus multilocularis TaxID=6211 RepID=A0A068YK11_ECHMU|nr:FAS associated factor 2 [Echinococcus multilocularis]
MASARDDLLEVTSSGGESQLNERQLSALVHFKIDVSPQNQHIYYAPRDRLPWHIQFSSFVLAPLRFACNLFCDLFKFLLSFIWSDSRRLVTNPADDVRNFIDDFKRRYLSAVYEVQEESDVDAVMPSPPVPPFYNGTYGEALKEAKQSLRFLIIYLHGDSHEDTDAFCRDTLLDPILLDFLNNTEQLLFWACNVNSAEGYRVSQTLREHTYPFIGVVGLSSNPAYSQTSFGPPTRMALLGRIEGLTSAPILIQHITKIVNDHQGILVAERAERAERELSTRLRQEQDEAFAASLARDRAKAAERAAHAEAEARLAQEIAETQRREKLLSRARLRRQRRWATSLPAEPSASVSTEVVRLSIKLPNGRRAQRLFSVKDSVKLLYYFIISQEDAPKHFAVESNYPKRIIECRPGDESDIEEYIPEENYGSSSVDDVPTRQVDDWEPKSPTDPPSFKDAGLAHPEMLFILDMDS